MMPKAVQGQSTRPRQARNGSGLPVGWWGMLARLWFREGFETHTWYCLLKAEQNRPRLAKRVERRRAAPERGAWRASEASPPSHTPLLSKKEKLRGAQQWFKYELPCERMSWLWLFAWASGMPPSEIF